MRKLKFNNATSSEVPIPYYEGGEVDDHLLSFLTARYFFPKQIRDNLDSIQEKTLTNIRQNVGFLINLFEEEGITYLEANYKTLSDVIASLYEDEEWLGSSLKVYAGHWRMFYDYLSKINAPHNMILPARTKIARRRSKEDNLLSHATSCADFDELNKETMVPNNYTMYVDDYREKVISMDQWFELQTFLHDEDPVYSVMATTMLQTFLRIGGVFQFPIAPTRRNPHWKRYAQLKQKKESFQQLNYIKKGQKPAKCSVHIYTMQVVEEDYLSTLYDERRKLYENKYVLTKHAKNQGRTEKDKFVWLNKNGTPVTIRELQSVFKRASASLNFDVTPHSLRHTGASQILYMYAKKNDITLSVELASIVHTWLSKQLGHTRLSTTEHYIRTVQRLEAENSIAELLPMALPKNLEALKLSQEHIEVFKKTALQNKQFFEGINYADKSE